MKCKTQIDTMPDILTTQEAARFLRCSDRHLISLIKKGQIKGRKIGRHYTIRKIDIIKLWED